MKSCRSLFFVLILLLMLCSGTAITANADSSRSFNSEQRKEIKEAIRDFLKSTKNLDFLPVRSFDADEAAQRKRNNAHENPWICPRFLLDIGEKSEYTYAVAIPR